MEFADSRRATTIQPRYRSTWSYRSPSLYCHVRDSHSPQFLDPIVLHGNLFVVVLVFVFSMSIRRAFAPLAHQVCVRRLPLSRPWKITTHVVSMEVHVAADY